MVVQWLRFHISTAGGEGLILGPELRFHMPLRLPLQGKKRAVVLYVIIFTM